MKVFSRLLLLSILVIVFVFVYVQQNTIDEPVSVLQDNITIISEEAIPKEATPDMIVVDGFTDDWPKTDVITTKDGLYGVMVHITSNELFLALIPSEKNMPEKQYILNAELQDEDDISAPTGIDPLKLIIGAEGFAEISIVFDLPSNDPPEELPMVANNDVLELKIPYSLMQIEYGKHNYSFSILDTLYDYNSTQYTFLLG